MQQTILDLGHSPALDRGSFLVSDSNREAVLLIDRWPDWPAHALIVYGPGGSGKSHLLTIWCDQANALKVALDDLTEALIASLITGNRNVALDDAGKPLSSACEQRLFHLYNAFKEQGRYLLLTAGNAPISWPIVLPDLKSRLLSLPVLPIELPDDDLLARLFVKLFADRQVTVPLDVIGYILPRMERSFAAVSRLVARLDAQAMQQKKPITIALAKMVLDSPVRD